MEGSMGEQSIQTRTTKKSRHRGHSHDAGIWMSDPPILSFLLFDALAIGWPVFLAPPATASHRGHDGHVGEETRETTGTGYPVPGAAFQVSLDQGKTTADGGRIDQSQANAALQTVI